MSKALQEAAEALSVKVSQQRHEGLDDLAKEAGDEARKVLVEMVTSPGTRSISEIGMAALRKEAQAGITDTISNWWQNLDPNTREAITAGGIGALLGGGVTGAVGAAGRGRDESLVGSFLRNAPTGAALGATLGAGGSLAKNTLFGGVRLPAEEAAIEHRSPVDTATDKAISGIMSHWGPLAGTGVVLPGALYAAGGEGGLRNYFKSRNPDDLLAALQSNKAKMDFSPANYPYPFNTAANKGALYDEYVKQVARASKSSMPPATALAVPTRNETALQRVARRLKNLAIRVKETPERAVARVTQSAPVKRLAMAKLMREQQPFLRELRPGGSGKEALLKLLIGLGIGAAGLTGGYGLQRYVEGRNQ